MSVIVDTSIWSLVLRRGAARDESAEHELRGLITRGQVVLLGAIRQELLSGVRVPRQFEVLRDRLRAFPDLPLRESDHEDAAVCFNTCRARGIQGSNTDFLICAVGIARGLAIYTADKDFTAFGRVLPLTLHAPAT